MPRTLERRQTGNDENGQPGATVYGNIFSKSLCKSEQKEVFVFKSVKISAFLQRSFLLGVVKP
jgi:hypothetical protein